MKIAINAELQNKAGPNASPRSTRHIEVELPTGVSYRVGDHLSVLPRNDAALVETVARRFGFMSADRIRLNVGEGRRSQLPVGEIISVGRLLTEFVELQQVATRKHIQVMADNTRCPVTKPKLLALCGEDAESSERYRNEVLGKKKSVFDLLAGASGLRAAVPPLSRNAVAAVAALLLDLVVAGGRRLALQRHGRGGRGTGDLGQRRLQGRVLELPCRPQAGRHRACADPRDQGGLPPARRSGQADHHDRPRHRAGAVPRLPAGARVAEGERQDAGSGDAVLRLPPPRAGFPLRRRAEGLRDQGISSCTSRSRAAAVRRPMCRT